MKFKTIKLPSMEEFESQDKSLSPYAKFYIWALNQMSYILVLYGDPDTNSIPREKVKEIMGEDGPVSVSDFWLNPNDSEVLDEIAYKWIRKYHQRSKKQAKYSHGMLKLDVGPAEFESVDDENKYPPGFVYIRMDNGKEKV